MPLALAFGARVPLGNIFEGYCDQIAIWQAIQFLGVCQVISSFFILLAIAQFLGLAFHCFQKSNIFCVFMNRDHPKLKKSNI